MFLALLLLAVVVAAWRRSSDPVRLARLDVTALREEVSRHPTDPQRRMALGEALDRVGQWQEAGLQFKEAADLNPNSMAARRRLVELLARAGLVGDAETELAGVLASQVGSPDYVAARAALAMVRRDFAGAARMLDEVTRRAPRDHAAWFALGECRLALIDEAGARIALEKAVELHPTEARYRVAFASTLRGIGDLEGAERQARDAQRLDPQSSAAHFELAQAVWERSGAVPEVETLLKQALALRPEAPLVHYAHGNYLQESGQLAPAVEAYRLAQRQLAASQPEMDRVGWDEWSLWVNRVEAVSFNLARVLRRLGRAAEADRELGRFREESTYRNRVHQLRVRVATQPRLVPPRLELARLYRERGHLRLAAEQYAQVLQRDSNEAVRRELATLQPLLAGGGRP